MHEKEEHNKKSISDKGKEKIEIEEDSDSGSSCFDTKQAELDFIPRLKKSKEDVLAQLELLLQDVNVQEKAQGNDRFNTNYQQSIAFQKHLFDFDESKKEHLQHLLKTVENFQANVLPYMKVGRSATVNVGDIITALQQFSQILSANIVHIEKANIDSIKDVKNINIKHAYLPSITSLKNFTQQTDKEVNLQIAQLKAVLQNCYAHQPGIPLLLDENKTFGIDEIFVNLELIRQPKNNKAKLAHQDEALYERREFRRNDESGKIIQPEVLFQKQDKFINRVFLQGAAGTGKTTLCRHLVYRWAQDNLWANTFELVIYLPLREIVVAYQYDKDYDLKAFVLGEWTKSATLGKRGRHNKLLIKRCYQHALWQLIKAAPAKVLWLLDGLDEVDRDHPAIVALLSADCYLVTSRPGPIPEGIERRVENIGLSPANRKKYIHRYYTLLHEEEKARSLIHWLKSNPQMWGLSSIAVACQLLCIAYQQNQQLPKDLSLTQLYDLLMVQWQRRAFLRDKTLHGKFKSDELAEWTDKKITNYYSNIIQLLGKICYHVLVQSSSVLFEGALLQHMIEEEAAIINATLPAKIKAEAETEAMHNLRVQLLNLGILKAQGLSTNPYQDRYEFAHLTFMEYLAASYTVSVLTVNILHDPLFAMLEKKPVIAIFTAGLLAKQASQHHELLHHFFARLNKTYINTAKYHQLALCYMEANLPELNELSKTIEANIKKEIRCILKGDLRSFIYNMKNFSWTYSMHKTKVNLLKINDLYKKNKISNEQTNGITWTWYDIQEKMNVYKTLNKIFVQKLDVLDDVKNALYYSESDKEFALTLIYRSKLFFKELKELLFRLTGEINNWKTLICIATEMKLGDDYYKALLGNILIKAPYLSVSDIHYIIKKLAALGVAKNEFIDGLLKRLNNTSVREISSTITALNRLNVDNNQFINPLLKRLQSNDNWMLESAIAGLTVLDFVSEQLILLLLYRLIDIKAGWLIAKAVDCLIKLGVSNEQIIIPLLKRLQDGISDVICTAAKQLIKLGVSDECIINPLIKCLQDNNSKVAHKAAEQLIKLKVSNEYVITPLLKRLEDDDSRVILEAANQLIKLGVNDERVIIPLLKCLNGNNYLVLNKAAEQLIKLGVGGERIVNPLIKRLQDNNSIIFHKAVKQLINLGVRDERIINPLFKCLQDGNSDKVDTAAKQLINLGASGERIINSLLNCLQYGDKWVVDVAAKYLIKLGISDERIINPLFKRLQDDDRLVVYCAAKQLIKLGVRDKRIINSLLKCLGDNNSWVIEIAAEQLIQLGVSDERIINPLLKRLKDGNTQVVLSAAEELIQLGISDERIINPLLKRLKESDYWVTFSAAEDLIDLGIRDERIIIPLLKHLEDGDRWVIDRAIKQLTQLGVCDERIINPLLGRLQDRKSKIVQIVSEQLIKLEVIDERIINPLFERLKDKNEKIVKVAEYYLRQLGVNKNSNLNAANDNLLEVSIRLNKIDQGKERINQDEQVDAEFSNSVIAVPKSTSIPTNIIRSKEQLELRIRKIISPSLQTAFLSFPNVAVNTRFDDNMTDARIVRKVAKFHSQSHLGFWQKPVAMTDSAEDKFYIHTISLYSNK